MSSHGSTDLLVTYFTDTWADAVGREMCFTLDRCLLEAVHDPRINQLMVANPYRSAPIAVARRLQGRPSPPLPPRPDPAQLVQPLRLRRHDPTNVSLLEQVYRRYDRRLRSAAETSGLERPAVITASPFVAAFCDLDWAGPVTYYGYDDWAALPSHRPWWSAIDAAYGEIRSRSRRVASVSQPIIDRIEPHGAAAVIPNAVEPAEWEPPWVTPAWSGDVADPMILYVGSLGDRLDVPLLERTAARIPGGELVLVGAVGDPGILARLSRIPNLRIKDLVNRRALAGLVHGADACIIPHRATRLTEAMSPLKLYEYLAAGRPVAATDLPPIREVDPRVIRASVGDAEGFADAVELALSSGAASEDERRRFITANSWGARFEQLLGLATDLEVPAQEA